MPLRSPERPSRAVKLSPKLLLGPVRLLDASARRRACVCPTWHHPNPSPISKVEGTKQKLRFLPGLTVLHVAMRFCPFYIQSNLTRLAKFANLFGKCI